MNRLQILKLVGIIAFLSLLATILYVITATDRVLKINEVTPTNTIEYSPTQQISISFSNISEEAKQQVAFVTNPYVNVAYYWDGDNLVVKPELFEPSIVYAARVYLGNKVLQEFNFKIKSEDQLNENEKETYQVAVLTATKKDEKELLKQKPWLENLPIILDEFSLTYDFENDVIRVRIFNSKDLTATTLKEVKESAAKKLISLDIPEETKVVYIND